MLSKSDGPVQGPSVVTFSLIPYVMNLIFTIKKKFFLYNFLVEEGDPSYKTLLSTLL
jgi:hypothetical protein